MTTSPPGTVGRPSIGTPRTARIWLLSLPAKRRDELKRKQLFFMYVQWIAFSQWQAIKAYGASKKVYLMGDIPFGVGRYSADVWANRAIFDLDWSGGAPPEKVFKVDPFTEKWGQNWGIPNYRWDELRRRDFDWWRTRVGNIQKVFHLYRIDHVLGFFRIYSFPWTPDRNAEFLPLTEAEAAAKTGGRLPGFKQFPDDTPEHKAANQAQGEELLRMVLEASGETTVVAEDLGVVPDYVRPTLVKLSIPGFRIPTLFREADGSYWDPKKYPRLSLAQPTTHDHPPLAAAWAECWQNIDTGKDVENNRRELRPDDGVRRVEGPGAVSRVHGRAARSLHTGRYAIAVLAGGVPDHRRIRHEGTLQHARLGVSQQLVASAAPDRAGAGRGPGAAGPGRDVLAPGQGSRAGSLMALLEKMLAGQPPPALALGRVQRAKLRLPRINWTMSSTLLCVSRLIHISGSWRRNQVICRLAN